MGSKSSKLDGEPRIRQSVLNNVKGHIAANKFGGKLRNKLSTMRKTKKFTAPDEDDIPIFVKGCHEYPTFEGKYEYVKDLESNEFFYKHEKRKLYLYRARNGSWFFSKNLWSTKAIYWTKEDIPGPTFPAKWFHYKHKKVAAVNEEFSIEREYVDNIPPTPTTSRRLKKCASVSEHVDKDETLLFRAYNKTSLSEWEDPFFHVNEKGDNNFQETESKTLNIHYNTRTLAWKCIWDGDIFYRVQNFSVTWQKKPFSVSMNFLNSINIDDVSQGDVGDCWLLSSIIAVVNFGQNLINDIICLEENSKNPNGPFKFKFHKCGKWHSVYVDNVLPMCGTARSAYYSMIKELFDDFFNRDSTGIDKTDFWVPLLEKAFAKFCGSYRMLIAGHPVRGLSYLTGGICVRMTLDRNAISTFETYQGATSFFQWLKGNLDKVMCCTSSNLRPENVKLDERTNSLGIAYNHAYSLLRAQVVTLKTKKTKEVELLKIRNPWNKKGNKTYETEWQGDWSDNSKLWKHLDLNSRTELPVNRDDGEFWISKDDWFKQFRVIDICYPPLFFESFEKMEVKETAIREKNCAYWQKGSHARHFQPSEEWPTETLIKLNESSGFSTYRFTIKHSKQANQLFIQMMFDLNYKDRLTWLKTIIVFDITRNKYLNPFLGECHDLCSANDSAIFHIEPPDMQNVEIEYAIQFKLSPKPNSNVDVLDYILRLYSKSKFENITKTCSSLNTNA